MSSLRISHQSRAAGAPSAADETGRADPPNERASFAVALGAAGLAPKETTAAPPGGQSGGAPEGSAVARKRVEKRGQPDDGAASLAAQGTVGAQTVLTTSALASPVGDGQEMQAAKGGDADVAAAARGAATISANSSNTGEPATAPAPPAPDGMAAATSAAPPAPDGMAAAADPSVPGHRPIPDAFTVGGTPTDAPAVAATGASGPSPTLAAPSPNVRDPGVTPVSPALLAGLSQTLPAVGGGLPSTGDNRAGSGAGNGERGRTAPTAAAPDAGDSAAAAMPGASGASALTASPAAAPSATPDPTAAGTISDQVAGQLVRLVSSGSRDMVMRLRPPELGDVTVRVAISGRDVSAWFVSPQPEVQSAISAAIGQLQTILGDAGYNLNGAWVGADASSARRQGANLPPLPPTRASSAAPAIGLSATASSRPAAAGLNIYV
jgi:hypothetical protein